MMDSFQQNQTEEIIMLHPHREGHNALMPVVCPSVPCLTLNRKIKGVASSTLTGSHDIDDT